MGKNKQNQDPESLKEAGNKAYSENKHQEACDLYTQAIEKDATNHIFFANSKWPNLFVLLNFV